MEAVTQAVGEILLFGWKKCPFLIAACVWLAFASSTTRAAYGGPQKSGRAALKRVFSLNDDDLRKLHPWGAWLDAFDISSDGKTFAAEFEALQEGHQEALWVGEWDTTTGALISERSIEGPDPIGKLMGTAPIPSAQFEFDVGFTPDGHELAVLAGPKIAVLNADNLQLLYSVSAKQIEPSGIDKATIRRFLISRDNSVLLVVTSAATFPWKQLRAGVFELQTGKSLANWTLPSDGPASFSLSPDGSELLVSDVVLQSDVLLMDSHSGRVIRRISSDTFGNGHSHEYGCQAEFLDGERMVVACPMFSGESRYALKIIDISTGKIVRQLGYFKHGIQAWFAIAGRAPRILALIFSWHWGLVWDGDNPFQRGDDWLTLFDANAAEPLTVRHDVRPFSGRNGPSLLSLRASIRISQDSKFVAFGVKKNIEVFRVQENTGSGKN